MSPQSGPVTPASGAPPARAGQPLREPVEVGAAHQLAALHRVAHVLLLPWREKGHAVRDHRPNTRLTISSSAISGQARFVGDSSHCSPSVHKRRSDGYSGGRSLIQGRNGPQNTRNLFIDTPPTSPAIPARAGR